MTAITTIVAALLGLGLWTLAEYGLHRFVMHSSGGWIIGREHRLHHREPLRTNAFHRAGGYLGLAAIGLVIGSPLAGWRPVATVALAIGWTAGYIGYDQIHWRCHHRAPRTAWGLRRRHVHLHHHFARPQLNHGVSSSVWDHVFGTYAAPTLVRVPASSSPSWLATHPTLYAHHFRLRS